MIARAWVFAAWAWLFLAGVVIQVGLAGAGLFGLLGWSAHMELGYTLEAAALAVPLLAYLARADKATKRLAIAVGLSGFIQPTLVHARTISPVIAAFHPINAMLLFWLAWLVARRSLAHVRPVAIPGSPGRGSLEVGTGPRV